MCLQFLQLLVSSSSLLAKALPTLSSVNSVNRISDTIRIHSNYYLCVPYSHNKQECKLNVTIKSSEGVSSDQLLSCVQLFVTPRTAARQASLPITNSQSLLKLMSRVGDAIQASHSLLIPSPPAFNPSQHQGPFK